VLFWQVIAKTMFFELRLILSSFKKFGGGQVRISKSFQLEMEAYSIQIFYADLTCLFESQT
jgi:hypothetical protein